MMANMQDFRRKKRSAAGDLQNEFSDMMSDMAIQEVELKDGVRLVVEEMFKHIDKLKDVLADIKHPTGKGDNPATTCRDILLGHPSSQDGKLNWIEFPFINCTMYLYSKIIWPTKMNEVLSQGIWQVEGIENN